MGRGYTPDAAVELASGERALVEVKYFSDLSSADTLARLTAIRRQLARSGFPFLWATDRELDKPDENLRIQTVKSYAALYTPRQRAVLEGRLRNRNTLTLGEAAQQLGGRAAALHLVAHRIYWVDFRRPLTEDAVLSRDPMEANHVVTLFSDW